MTDNSRLSIIFLLNLVLYFVAGELNVFVSNWSVYFHIDALLVIFFGLYLSRSSSVVLVALMGMLADSVHPAPVGTYFAGYLFLWLFFVWMQRRLQRHNQSNIRSVAAAGQAVFVIYLTLLLGKGQFTHLLYWNRVLTDLLLSTMLVFLISWPWCQFQKRILHTLGWNIEAQMSRR
jgi:cell shape-determining protein MreD